MFSNILKKYSSVDTKYGTDKLTSHSYGQVYDSLFSKYENTCKNILEIGFDGGFALQAYSEYFINSMIYGIDIKDINDEYIKNNEKIKICIGDACSEKIINHFNINYDIIIEDASHLPQHQIQHFKDYSKFVNSGGIYIIEDVHGNFSKMVFDKTSKIADENGFKYELIDLQHIKGRFDDILIVFTKL